MILKLLCFGDRLGSRKKGEKGKRSRKGSRKFIIFHVRLTSSLADKKWIARNSGQ
jgi:hypothetical protein